MFRGYLPDNKKTERGEKMNISISYKLTNEIIADVTADCIGQNECMFKDLSKRDLDGSMLCKYRHWGNCTNIHFQYKIIKMIKKMMKEKVNAQKTNTEVK